DQLSKKGYIYQNGTLGNIGSISKLMNDFADIKSDILAHPQVELTYEEKKLFSFNIEEPFTFRINDTEARREIISNTLFPYDKYPIITNSPEFIEKLHEMFRLYDYWFFSGLLSYA